MDSKKREQVYNILVTPIISDKSISKIVKVDNFIRSPQKYYSSPDEDMSDFAIGFYRIIYLEYGDILTDHGTLKDCCFAGDTMNSFNSIANITHGTGKSKNERKHINWEENCPKLFEYYNRYHCLANF